ncbi:MAG: DUF3999 family protein [Thermoguttaceae bacterium]|jgi:hypothetical protein
MRRFGTVCLLVAAVAGWTAAGGVAAAPSGGAGEPAEALSAWPWQHEIQLPKPGVAGRVAITVPVSVFDEARRDLGDLRLYDGRGREVPYALRVRSARNERQQLAAQEFNRQANADRSVEVSLDLGPRPAEHEEVDVRTAGSDFRRRVVLEGSDNRRDWGTLLGEAWVVRFRVDDRDLDIHRLHYPAGRFRYLRVRVYPDLGKPADAPKIEAVGVYHTVREPGEYVTRPAILQPREAVPAKGGPGSAWVLDLGGRHVPCEKLLLEIDGAEFVRPYQVEELPEGEGLLEGEGPRQVVASGQLRREAGEARKPLEIPLGREVQARRLRLVVTDHHNPPLAIHDAHYTAAARQVVFERGKDLVEPLRLYAGNYAAGPPHYDFAAALAAVLEPQPATAELGPPEPNPIFEPEPKPWTERWPWLVYVVLGVAGAGLLAMLGGLARAAIRRHDAGPAAA